MLSFEYLIGFDLSVAERSI